MTDLNLKAGMTVKNKDGIIGILSDYREKDYPLLFNSENGGNYSVTITGDFFIEHEGDDNDIVEIIEDTDKQLEDPEQTEEKYVFNQQEKDILEHAGVAYRIDFDKQANEGKAYRVSFEVSQAEALRRQMWIHTASKLIGNHKTIERATTMADEVLAEYDKRFPDHT
jgi:hypothetical protein